jgi:hypothetical protein
MEEMTKDGCPLATRDLTLNLKNRGKAIDKAMYGPMNPNEPNDPYWSKMAAKWDVPVEEAKSCRCGNCSAFNQTSKMLDCIDKGLAPDRMKDAMEVQEAGDLGFCELFDFKCAAKRTCAAWIVGGPITDDKESEDKGEMENDGEYSDMRTSEG